MSFLDLYSYESMAGKSEVPTEYHQWAAYSLVAAALANRVCINQWGTDFPNLYTILIGPGSSGKNAAIDHARDLALEVEIINAREFRTTAAALLDTLCENPAQSDDGLRTIEYSKIFIIMSELADCIGSGPQASDVVTRLTDLWDGHRRMIERTRDHGEHVLFDPLINWLAGTTKEWLFRSISIDDFQGGFFSRVCCVQLPPNYEFRRIWRLDRPADLSDARKILLEKLALVSEQEGEMVLSEKADRYLEQWHYSRELPSVDDPAFSLARRQMQIVFKLGMILAISDDPRTRVVELKHVEESRRLTNDLKKHTEQLLTYASVTPKTSAVHKMTVMLKQERVVSKAKLLTKLNVTLDDFELALATLKAAKSIKFEHKGRNTYVEWTGN